MLARPRRVRRLVGPRPLFLIAAAWVAVSLPACRTRPEPPVETTRTPVIAEPATQPQRSDRASQSDATARQAEEAEIRAAFEALAIDKTGSDGEAAPDATLPPPAACPVTTAGPPTSPGRWPARSSWYEGGSQLDAALKDSRQSYAPLFIYFHTDWCGYCRRFEEGLLSDPEVSRFMRSRVVKLKVNPEDGPGDRQVADRYGVSGYPTLVVVLQPEQRSRRLSPYARGGDAQLLSPRSFISQFEEAEAETQSAFVLQAQQLLQDEAYPAAIDAAEAALAIDPENRQALAYRAQARLALGDLDAAFSDLQGLAAAGSSGDTTPFSLAATALGAKGRWSESAACLGEVLRRHPLGSTYFARAQALAASGQGPAAAEDARQACEMGYSQACDWEPSRS